MLNRGIFLTLPSILIESLLVLFFCFECFRVLINMYEMSDDSVHSGPLGVAKISYLL